MKTSIMTLVLLIFLSGCINFQVNSKVNKDSFASGGIPEAELSVKKVLTDCYSDDHCIIDLISGEFTNKGTSEIYSLFINYIILDKNSEETLFEEQDVSPRFYTYGANLKLLKQGEKELFSSEKVFLTKKVPKGDYALLVELVDARTESVIGSAKVDLKMQSVLDSIKAES